MTTTRMNRRQFIEKLGEGSLVVGFSLLSPVAPSIVAGDAHAASAATQLTILSGIASGPPPGQNDAWLVIDHQGNVTLFSGKVEIGTGTQTAFSQIVAEELHTSISKITYVQGDTAETPDQGFTAGSKSIQVQGPLLRRAAATAYGLLGQQGTFNSNPSAPIKDPSTYTIVGKPVPRLDLTAKCTGTFDFVSDITLPHYRGRPDHLELPGLLHGRVLRNNFVNGVATTKPKNATFSMFDAASFAAAQAIPGFVQTVQKGNFVGVVATTEWAAIQAARTLQVVWSAGHALVSDSAQPDLQTALTTSSNIYASSTQEVVVNATAPATITGTRTYYTPYHMHGSVGPSCAVADVTSVPDADGFLVTVWSGTQGVYPLQLALADILNIPASAIRVIYIEGAGCYGHNGSDDVAADAALMSQLVGRPVRVQWMRQDEHGWEPLGPALAHTLTGGLDQYGNVVSWSHTLFSPPHSSRPGGGGSLLAGQEIGLFPPPLPKAPVNQGTRNGPVNYNFPNMKLSAFHVQPYGTNQGVAIRPLVNTLPRSTALRSLGGLSNCFANESFMDEMALAANADPIAFRKKYVCALSGSSGSATSVPLPGGDPRATAALDAMAQQAGWGNPLAPARTGAVAGKGVAFARYETVETYVAVYAEVEVTTGTGVVWVRRVVVAHDCGLIINPDGLRNQIEGNVIQGISRTLIEEVEFNGTGVTSLLWSTYPVIHFSQVPSSIEIVLLNHPEQLTQDPSNVPAWGAGEPTIGPVAPAIANAIFNAIGKRMTMLPITPQRVLNA